MFLGIQYLRAIAALMVVVFHLKPQLARAGLDADVLNFGATGVDIFFVISGFVMWHTTRKGDVTPLSFYWRRIVRIVPLYWLLTSFILAVMLVAPLAMQTSRFVLEHVVASYLFWPHPHPVYPDSMEPLLFAGWTLNYEMFFYLIFGVALLLPTRARLFATIGALVGLVALQAVGFAPGTAMSFYTSSIVLEFGLGVLLGYLVQTGVRLPANVSLAFVIVGAVALVAGSYADGPRFVTRGIAAGFVVFGAVFYEQARTVASLGWLKLLGDASYSTYLSHGILLSALGQAWRKLPLAAEPVGVALFAVAGVCLAIVGGLALYRFVEQPIIHIFRPAPRKTPVPQTGAAPRAAAREAERLNTATKVGTTADA